MANVARARIQSTSFVVGLTWLTLASCTTSAPASKEIDATGTSSTPANGTNTTSGGTSPESNMDPGSTSVQTLSSGVSTSGVAMTGVPASTNGQSTATTALPSSDVLTANVTTSTTAQPETTAHTDAGGAPDASVTTETGNDSSPITTNVDVTSEEPADPCAAENLTWRSGHKTNYESYPDPGSEECIEFNGCYWAGMFAACNDKMPEEWVEEHNIVALFPQFEELKLHDLCIRSGNTTMVVTVFDTCGDSDCDGCCTENRGSADALIDLEKYTNERWGLPDGDVEWADLGPTQSAGCD